MKQLVFMISLLVLTLLTACVGGSRAMRSGGEVTGQRSVTYNEPTPFGMVEVKRGFLRAGMEMDSLWGIQTPQREISVDGFWMDQTEVTNSMYRQFVEWVRDSIIRLRLSAVHTLAEHVYLHTSSQLPAPQRVVVGILHRETLVREEAYLIIYQREPYPMSRTPKSKSHIGTSIKRTTRIFIPHSMCL